MGRNNERSPIGEMVTLVKPSRLLKENQKVYNAWFESWLLNHVPKLMNQEKWFSTSHNIQVGDLVLFAKNDSVLCKTYQYGMVIRIEFGKDNVVRKAYVRYRNASEDCFRETYRSARDLIIIRSVDEIDILEELYDMSK